MKQPFTLVFIALFTFSMIVAVMHFFPVGDPHMPGYADFVPKEMPPNQIPQEANSVALRYTRMTATDVGATCVVGATILDYRGYDTFYETTVLFATVIAVLAVIGRDEDHT